MSYTQMDALRILNRARRRVSGDLGIDTSVDSAWQVLYEATLKVIEDMSDLTKFSVLLEYGVQTNKD